MYGLEEALGLDEDDVPLDEGPGPEEKPDVGFVSELKKSEGENASGLLWCEGESL